MKQKIGLFLCLALLLTGCSYQTKTIRFGAADIGGMYYTVANAYAGLASEESSDLKFEVKNTAGSAANLRLLSGNYIDLGIAQADLVRAAHEGTGSFSDNRQQGYRAIAGLYTEACQIVVRADSDIRTLNDLQGKTVSIGASESGTEQNATEILKLSGLTAKLVHMVNLDYADAAGKLASGEIDALFCTAGIRTAVIEELAKECDLRLLSIDDTCLEKLLATTKEYSKYVIPANTYSGQDEDVTTIGVKAVLLASDALSEKTVEKLTEILFSHAQDLAYATSLDAAFDETDASSGVTIPFHPGAAAYYAGQGISVNTK